MTATDRTPYNYDPDYMKEENIIYVDELRVALSNDLLPEHTDLYLYKFLKARDFKVQVAAELFRTMLEYRRREDIDNIIDNYVPTDVCLKYLTNGYHGTSKSGHLVWYDRITLIDPKGFLKSCRPIDFRNFMLRETEIMRKIMHERIKETGRPCHQNVQVIDLQGLSTSHLNKAALDTFSGAIADMESNYPESLYKLFVVRAPSLFPVAFNMVKGVLPPETQKKIMVLSKNYLEVLQEHIEIDQIPDFLGGECKRCIENNKEGCGFRPVTANMMGLYEGVRPGGKIPVTEYLDANVDSWDNVEIKSGKGESIRVNVPEVGTVLRYEFSSKDYLLDFSLNYTDDTTESTPIRDMELITEKKKNSTAFVPISENHICSKAGTYVLYFNNAHHYSAAKLWYKIEVLAAQKKTVVAVSMNEVNEAGAIDSHAKDPDMDDLHADTISRLSASPDEKVSMEGHLLAYVKEDEKSTQRNWVGRHHVLTDAGRLYIYRERDDEKPTGCHRLEGVAVREFKGRNIPVGENGKFFVLELKDERNNAELLLAVENKDHGKEWLTQLQKVCVTRSRKSAFLKVRRSMVKSRSHDNLKKLDVETSYSDKQKPLEKAPSLKRGNNSSRNHSPMPGSPKTPLTDVQEDAQMREESERMNKRLSMGKNSLAASIDAVSANMIQKEGGLKSRSVVTIACSPFDSLAQKMSLDDGKDIIILMLLIIIALTLAY